MLVCKRPLLVSLHSCDCWWLWKGIMKRRCCCMFFSLSCVLWNSGTTPKEGGRFFLGITSRGRLLDKVCTSLLIDCRLLSLLVNQSDFMVPSRRWEILICGTFVGCELDWWSTEVIQKKLMPVNNKAKGASTRVKWPVGLPKPPPPPPVPKALSRKELPEPPQPPTYKYWQYDQWCAREKWACGWMLFELVWTVWVFFICDCLWLCELGCRYWWHGAMAGGSDWLRWDCLRKHCMLETLPCLHMGWNGFDRWMQKHFGTSWTKTN